MIKRFVFLSLLSIAPWTWALNLELTQGVNAALPIGINSFGWDGQAKQLTQIIEHDLRFCGQFKLIPSLSSGLGHHSAIADWRQAGADSVLTGKIAPLGNGRYEVNFELLDATARGRLLVAKSYQIHSSDLPALAHHISDEVYYKLTGEKGIFSTRIAYILVQRTAVGEQHTLVVADIDGHNPQNLLTSTEPIMSPTWSPDGSKIAYVSFEKKRAQVYNVEVESGKRRLLTDFPGINGAPAWSPDGRQLAVVLSKGGSPKIYSVDLSNGSMKQLTFGDAIDTEPRYAPDGQSLLFTSGRGGSPQVYRLTLADGKVQRVTYEGNYNARASFTPSQRQIVMLHREDKNFNIGVQDIEQGSISQLTFSSMDESPSVSPNGRLILYATHDQGKGVLAMVSIDGRIRIRLPAREGDIQEPAWSPYLG